MVYLHLVCEKEHHPVRRNGGPAQPPKEGLSMSENAEFDKWWQDWITTVAQRCTVVEHAASANKPGEDVVPKLDDFTK